MNVQWPKSFIEQEKLIASIVQKDHGLDDVELAFITEALANEITTRFFVKHARSRYWLSWLDSNGLLDCLFEPGKRLTAEEELVSRWVASSFMGKQSPYIMELIAAHGQSTNPSFWRSLMWQITHPEDKPHGYLLAAWVTLLISQTPTQANRELDYLMHSCRWPEDMDALMMLFSHLLQPIPVAERSMASIVGDSEFKFEYSLTLRGEHHWLESTWTQIKPHASEIWRRLQPTVQKYLTDAFQTNVGFGRAGGDEDPMSFWRSAIEPHEQDQRNKRSFDVLVDVARDILEYLLSDSQLKRVGVYLTENWFSTEVPLLRRISIHGIGYGDFWTPDEKIEWLLQHELIYRHWYKYEVFQVLKKALGRASGEAIEKLLQVVDVDRSLPDESEERNLAREYEKYNLLRWMHESVPVNPHIRKALDTIQTAHPTWSRREHPELDHWSGGAQLVIPESPVTRDQLKGMPVTDAVSLLLTFKPKDPQDWRDERRGLLERLQGLATSDFDWSMSIADRVADSPDSKEDIWYHLIKGWEKASLSDDDVLRILSFMSVHPRSIGTHTGVAEYMEALVRSEKTTNERVLESIESLSDQVWEMLNDPNEQSKFWSGSWLTTALNHWSGHTAEIWLHTLDRRKKLAGDDWTGLPVPYKARFTKLLDSNSLAAQLARCVIVSRLHYLQYLDSEWTREHLLPLMDFGRDKLTAEQSWHGYLFWGQLTRDQVAEMKPVAVSAALRLEDGGENFRKLLFERITDMMIIDPSEEPDWVWFYSILSNGVVTDMELGNIAKRIEQTLREADDKFTIGLWTRWLKKYWSDRIEGKPIPMSPQEGDSMLAWPLYLGEFFTEAVEIARRISVFELRFTHLFSDLQDSKLVEEYPQEVARWVTHTLKPQKDYEQHSFYLVPLYQKLKEILGAEAIVELTEELVRLGFVSAVD